MDHTQRKEGRNGFLHCFQQPRSYRDEVETHPEPERNSLLFTNSSKTSLINNAVGHFMIFLKNLEQKFTKYLENSCGIGLNQEILLFQIFSGKNAFVNNIQSKSAIHFWHESLKPSHTLSNQNSPQNFHFGDISLRKTSVWDYLKGKMLLRTQLKTLLQIFCKFLLYSYVIVKSIRDPDVNFNRYSWGWTV